MGILRFVLAVLVVMGHVGFKWWPAALSVFSFYVLSGFLMTLIINERYGVNYSGFKAFWKNRILKLFPSYYFAVLFGIIVILIVGEEYAYSFTSGLFRFPNTIYEYISNVTIVGQIYLPPEIRSPSFSMLSPSTWALSIEIVFYLIISAWAAFSLRRAIIMLGIGMVYHALAFFLNAKFYWHYFFPLAATLPFSLGVISYFLYKKVQEARINLSNSIVIFILFVYIISFTISSIYFSRDIASLFITSVSLSIFIITFDSFNKIIDSYNTLKAANSYLGDLSYPIYLCHWQVCILTSYFLGISQLDKKYFPLYFVLVIFISIIDKKLIQQPIEQYRNEVKKKLKLKQDEFS